MSNHKHDKITAPLNVFANAEFENWSSASCSVPPDKMVGCGLSGVPLGPFSSSEQFYEVANSYNLISFVHFSKNRGLEVVLGKGRCFGVAFFVILICFV